MEELADRVAVVTGGASGIGEGLVEALLEAGAIVVIADVEEATLEEALTRFRARGLGADGRLSGIVTDVSRPESVEACAGEVFGTHGRCHLLFNNAGVGGGGVAKPWNWTPNDWAWCIGVNLFGVANCVASFVPRMIEGGEVGWVVNTSSGNGGVQPLADLGVYAASKAAVTSYTECLANAFIAEGTALHAALFFPGGNGLLETRLWNSGRNRPPELAREHPHVDQQWDFQEHKAQMEERGVKPADLVELGRVVLQGIHEGRFVLGFETESGGELLQCRAERFGRGELPTVRTGSIFE